MGEKGEQEKGGGICAPTAEHCCHPTSRTCPRCRNRPSLLTRRLCSFPVTAAAGPGSFTRHILTTEPALGCVYPALCLQTSGRGDRLVPDHQGKEDSGLSGTKRTPSVNVAASPSRSPGARHAGRTHLVRRVPGLLD